MKLNGQLISQGTKSGTHHQRKPRRRCKARKSYLQQKQQQPRAVAKPTNLSLQ